MTPRQKQAAALATAVGTALVVSGLGIAGVHIAGQVKHPVTPPPVTITTTTTTTTPSPSPTTPKHRHTPTPTPSATPSPTPSPSHTPTGSDNAQPSDVMTKVSGYTTHYPPATYRNINQTRAAALINGTILQPGQQFSFNSTVGERTAANGFVPGYIIADGRYQIAYGGGVSQVATTLYNAALIAGLHIDERHAHSFYIDRYPIGRDATVAWGSLDLRFTNDTPHNVLIKASVTPSNPGNEGAMHVSMWSTPTWHVTFHASNRYDITAPGTRYITQGECVPTTGYDGFTIDVTRNFHKPNQNRVVRHDTIHTVYTPADTVVCGPQPTAPATTAPAAQ